MGSILVRVVTHMHYCIRLDCTAGATTSYPLNFQSKKGEEEAEDDDEEAEDEHEEGAEEEEEDAEDGSDKDAAADEA